MLSRLAAFVAVAFVISIGLVTVESVGQNPTTGDETKVNRTAEIVDLRDRARLLHDVVHATLQVVHHRYYREDEGLLIPAAALKRVFAEVEDRHDVKLRWLAVDAPAMNQDHEPRSDFDKQAVSLLSKGRPDFELVESGVYRRAAPIRLSNECLKCHVPNRTNTADRIAALLIEIPLRE